MDLPTGTLIDDKYEIVGRIGAGGMGCVYKAKQHPFEREVAIKMLSAELPTEDPEAIARLEREAMAISAIKHKYIVMFYGYGIWKAAPYMVMECVNGTNLQDLLQTNNPLDPSAVIRIVLQLCEALSCAHAYGVVHRDLKPNNIMIVGDQSQGFSIKVIDFGLARVMPTFGVEVQKLTQAGCALGSVLYMSPEQCVGEESDPRSDLYAVGCIMHHCLTGLPPYIGDHSVVVMQRHLADPLPRLRDSNPKLSNLPILDSLQSFLDKATAKNPRDRYQTAEDMAADLKILDGGESAKIEISGTAFGALRGPATQDRKRRPIGQIAVIAALSIIACGSVAFLSARVSEPPKGPVSETESPTRLFEAANRAFIDNKLDIAVPLFERAIADDKNVHLLGASERIRAYNTLAEIFMVRREFAKCAAVAHEGLEENLNEISTAPPEFRTMIDRYITAADAIGETQQANQFLRKIVDNAQKTTTRESTTWQLRLLARARAQNMPNDEYVSTLRNIESQARDPEIVIHTKVVLSAALLDSRQIEEGKKVYKEAKAFLEQHHSEVREPLVFLWMARGSVTQGDSHSAREYIDEFVSRLPTAAFLATPALAYCDVIENKFDSCVQRCKQTSEDTVGYNASTELEAVRDLKVIQKMLRQKGRAAQADEVQNYIVRLEADIEHRFPGARS